MDKNEKFDRFIEDFDRKLNTDTSTYKTILTRPKSPTPSPESAAVPKGPPLLTTPTKARRNSISPDDAPLSSNIMGNVDVRPARELPPSPSHMELPAGCPAATPPSESPGIKAVRLSGQSGGLKRSSTIGGINSVHRQPSMRRGLNLGLNLKPTNAPTSARQGSLRSPELVVPAQEASKCSPAPDRQVHQSRGQDFSTPTHPKTPTATADGVSMAPFSTTSTTTTNRGESERRDRRNTNSSVMSSEYTDVDDSLRTLAAKEMQVIELRHKLKLLQQELESEEQELKKLRDKVGNTIYKGISPQHNPVKAPETNSASTASQSNRSKRESIWSKPVNFLNQFDQLLQTEIERINKEGFKHPNEIASDKTKKDGNSGYSLWSFVNDVKHGLLGEDDSPTRERSKQLQDISSEDEGESNQEEMVTIRN